MPYTTDWTIEGNYPDPKTATLPMWAWEFLRRNANYCADWEFFAIQIRAAAARAGHPNNALFAEFYLSYDTAAYDWYRLHSDKATYLRDLAATENVFKAPTSWQVFIDGLPIIEPPRATRETEGMYYWRDVKTNDLGALRLEIGGRWGLTYLRSPLVALNQSNSHPTKQGYGNGFSALDGDGLWLINYNTNHLSEDAAKYHREVMDSAFNNPNRIIVSFDLSMRLEPQIARLKQMAARVDIPRRQTKRNQSKQYLKYLRVFDARGAGVTYRLIGQTVTPKRMPKHGDVNQDSQLTLLKMWHREAKRLVDANPMELALAVR